MPGPNPAIQAKRDQEVELLRQVTLSLLEPGLQALKRLLELRLAREQAAMLQCQREDFPGIQGRAQSINFILKNYLTEQP